MTSATNFFEPNPQGPAFDEAAGAPELRLPALRQDLKLLAGPSDESGAPSWLIHDLARNQFFQIDEQTFFALTHWVVDQSAAEFMQNLQVKGQFIDMQDIQVLLQFLGNHQLLLATSEESSKALYQRMVSKQRHPLQWLVHNYLFFKIPLFSPDAWVTRALPWAQRLFNPWVLRSIVVLGVLGLFLTLRQWDVFITEFLYFFTWQGIGLYLLTLIIVKSAHELGHAFVAKAKGARISSIGVAFLVMFPVLYTDTTDSWRLTRSRDRLQIALAGIKTEVYIALLATFAWSFLPDGPLRSAAFFVATTSWVTSLLINVNPFMRFDGYFALSDCLRAPNLQPRAFALGRWALREILFNAKRSPPEILPSDRRQLFIVYAWATWLYRFLLFIGIALLVYHFAFKLLGMVLFAIEIIWFIALPVWREMKAWKSEGLMTFNRRLVVIASLVFLLLVFALIPWRPTFLVPAVIEDQGLLRVFAPQSAVIQGVYVQNGQQVKAGDVLLQLQDSDLSHERLLLKQRLDAVELQLSRQAGNPDVLVQRNSLIQRRAQLQLALNDIEQRLNQLLIRAPHSGTVQELTALSKGQWLSDQEQLMVLKSEQGTVILGFLPEEDVARVQLGARGKWYQANWVSGSIPVVLQGVESNAVDTMRYRELTSLEQGPMAASEDGQHKAKLEKSHYQVIATPVIGGETVGQRRVGWLEIEGQPRSWFGSLWNKAVGVWVRETSF